ncbi:DIP2 disco-interacting protein 2 C, partial [Entomortierella chlamydospora]
MSSVNIALPESVSTADVITPALDGASARVDNITGAVSPATVTLTKETTANSATPIATAATATTTVTTTPIANVATVVDLSIQPQSNSDALGIRPGDNRLQQPIEQVTQTDVESNSRTPIASGERLSLQAVRQAQESLEPIQGDNIDINRNTDTDACGAVGLVPGSDEIASDVQERSQLGEEDNNSIKLGDEDEATGPEETDTTPGENQGITLTANNKITQIALGDSIPGKPSDGEDGKSGDANLFIKPVTENTATTAVHPNIDDAATSAQAQSLDVSLEAASESQASNEDSEPMPSYMSPNHEWARILQKRLGKGLNDAQMLARSNSMLASPSILAQSLIQVIPSLQVKDTGAASPGSSGREYQTAEELFDRPASIEPPEPAFHYDEQHSKDTSFPSSTIVNSSQAPLLLFAPLNPDQLHGKKSSSSQPTAPPPPSAEPVSQPQPLPASISSQPQPKLQQQQTAPVLLSSAPQPNMPPPIPIPIPPIAVASSPAARAHVVIPAVADARQSPLMTREQGVASTNIRQGSVSCQEEKSGLIPQGSSNSRILLTQGSSSSLTALPSVLKDQPINATPNYPAPIQYTPVTQYKANPSKESSKANKKSRDIANTAKEVTAIAESPTELKVVPESAPATTIIAPTAALAAAATTVTTSNTTGGSIAGEPNPVLATTADGATEWAMEALSGLSDVDFDATLSISAVVATTIAGASQSKDAPVKPPMMIPPISVGSKSSTTTAETPSKPAKVIPSPFESDQILVEQQLSATPELKSKPLQVSTTLAVNPNLVPSSSSAPVNPTSVLYSGAYHSASATQSNYAILDQNNVTAPPHHGSRGTHQASRSVSSLRDIQMNPTPIERVSQEFSYPRRSGSAYQIPWLPQSQPILPPKADINSIDVPALTGRQQLPQEPRPFDAEIGDPCYQFKHIGEAIRHWGQHTPGGNAFANLNGAGVESGSWDWAFTLGRAEMIARSIHDKTQLRAGARVALVFRLSEILEFVAAFYGAILAGVVPVLINQIQDFSEMVYIMTSANVELALTTQANHKSLLTDIRKGALWPSGVTWWQTDLLETWTPKNNQQERLPLVDHEYAYIEYTKSGAGELKGVAISHKNLIAQCQALYSSFSWRPALYRDKNGSLQTDPLLALDPTAPPANDRKKRTTNKRPPGTVMTWLEPRQQAGLVLGSIMGVFCGSFTVFMDTSITAVSGLWAHTIAAYRATIAFTDYTGMQRLLRNFKSNPHATITPTRPDLRFLQTVYVDTHSNNPALNREFLDDYLYPLGMIARQDPAQVRGSDQESKESSLDSSSSSNFRMVRNDLGVIPFLSLPEHGGMILCLRDNLDAPHGTERIDLRKQYRKSTLPRPRLTSNDSAQERRAASSSDLWSAGQRVQPPGSEPKNGVGELLNHPVSAMACGEYLLQREPLRSNRIVILATGDEAFKRRDEPGAILVGAFGYPLAQSTVLIVDPETLALSLPDTVGEIWVSSPGMPVSFWDLPEHTQDVFYAKPYIVTEETMIPTVYRPPGCERILRTGLLGATIEGRIVVFGPYWDRLQQDMADPMKPIGVEYEYHHCSDLINTLYSRVGGIGEVSIFECFVNKEYLPVVCIELTRDNKWSGQSINTVAQHVAINARHYLKEVNAMRSYCVAVWDINTLPRILENGRRVIDHALCKKMFELGRIYKMLYFATFTDEVLFNITQGDDPVNGFWSRECVAMRQRRQGSSYRYVQYTSNITSPDAYDEKANVPMGKFHSITDILIWRTITQPDEIAFIDLDSKGKEQKIITFKKFNQRVTGYAMHLDKKHGLKAGDHVILWFSQELDYVVTLHACWVLGLIPIPLQLPENPQTDSRGFIGHHSSSSGVASSGLGGVPFGIGSLHNANANAPTLLSKDIEDRKRSMLRSFLRIMDEVKIKAILGNATTDEYLKQKSTGALLRSCRSSFTPNFSQTPEVFSSADIVLPTFCNVSKAAKSKQTLGILSGYAPRKEWLSAGYPAVYLIDPEAKAGTIASKKLLKMNHEILNNVCRNQKLQFNALTGQPVVTGMSIFHGLGFSLGCLCGIYNGGTTVILQPADFNANPVMWLEAVSRYKARDVALTYPMLDQLLSRLDVNQAPNAIFLEYVKNLMVCTHGRAQQEKNKTAIARLGALKLEREALNLIYSHPLNPMVTSQAERAAGPVRIYVSSKSLRFGIVSATSEGDDPTGIWLEDIGVSTVCTSIAIVHPETLEVCAANQIGEIWVCSDSSVNSFYSPPGFPNNSTYPQPFNACIAGYDPRFRYIRTGDLGFLWNGQQHQLQRQQANPGHQAGQVGTGSFQLFVLGRLEESFQVHGLLHFSVDIESTVESSHANVATQG